MPTQPRAAAQPRAEATRQDIIDAAVDLFISHGYGDAKLNDIVDRAGVTTGAFYYHFGTKEALAFAIIAQGWPKALTLIDGYLSGSGPGLERAIGMTFGLSDLMRRDRVVWISNHLNQTFGELSADGRRQFKQRAKVFIARVAAAIRPEELRPDVTPTDVGNLVWITVHGCHLLSDAMDDDVIDRLARCWRDQLRGLVIDDAQPHLEEFVARTAAEFSGHQRPS